MYHKLSIFIAKFLIHNNEINKIEYLKLVLGIEIILINLVKTSIITIGSIIAGIFLETLMLSISFFLIRIFSHGYHFSNSFLYTIYSLFLFVLIPFGLSITGPIYFPLSIILIIFSFILLYRYAPCICREHPFTNKQQNRKLRNNALLVTMIFAVLSLFIHIYYSQFITLGVLYAGIHTLPYFKERT